jgi:hypothetical protein
MKGIENNNEETPPEPAPGGRACCTKFQSHRQDSAV